MNVKVSTIYEACNYKCNDAKELHEFMTNIEGAFAFVDLIHELYVDELGFVKGTNYEIADTICNLILGKPLKLESTTTFEFGKKATRLYSREMYASLNYAKSKQFTMADFYLNLRYPEEKLYEILKDLKDTVDIFHYSTLYKECVGYCVDYYVKLRESV